mmetsp:Transcript_5486/g.14328  ORF Transcript_5486/g.14328 Transcript_5486/m.14328 type:complete len:1400 (-) Transcript_5486:639-4838(-)
MHNGCLPTLLLGSLHALSLRHLRLLGRLHALCLLGRLHALGLRHLRLRPSLLRRLHPLRVGRLHALGIGRLHPLGLVRLHGPLLLGRHSLLRLLHLRRGERVRSLHRRVRHSGPSTAGAGSVPTNLRDCRPRTTSRTARKKTRRLVLQTKHDDVGIVVDLFLLLLLLLLDFVLAFLGFLLQTHEPVSDLFHRLNEERHGVIENLVHPSNFDGDIRPDELEARIEKSGEALAEIVLEEEVRHLLGELGILADRDGVDGVPPQLVLLADLERLLVLAILAVHHGSKPSELDVGMSGKSPSEVVLVKVVKGLDRQSQLVEIALLEQNLVERVVDFGDVRLLGLDKEALAQGKKSEHAELVHARVFQDLNDPRGLHLRSKDNQEVVEKLGLLVDVELDCFVHDLEVARTGNAIGEALGGPCRRRVVDHRFRRVVEFVVLHLQVGHFLVHVRGVALADQAGNVATLPPHLEVVHRLFGLVLDVEDAQLRKHGLMSLVQAERVVHDVDDLVEVAPVEIVVDAIHELVGLEDEVHRANLRKSELLGVDARVANLAPRRDAVALARSLHRALEVAKLDQDRRQLGKVRGRTKQNLRSAIQLIVIAALTDVIQIGTMGLGNKLLDFGEAVALAQSKHDFRVDDLDILCLVLRKLEELDDDLVLLLGRMLPCGGDDELVRTRVLGPNEALNTPGDDAVRQLGLAEFGPNVRSVHLDGVLLRARKVLQVLEEHVHGFVELLEALVDRVGFFEEVRTDRKLGDVVPIVIVQAPDVFHDALLVALHRRQNEQILEVLVPREDGVAGLEHKLLEQLHENLRQIGGHESFDSGGNLLRFLGFQQRRRDDLIDDDLPVRILLAQGLRPQLRALPVDEVLGLLLEERVGVGDVDQLLVAFAPLVRRERKVRIALLAERADGSGVVVRVRVQKVLRVDVALDVHLPEPGMNRGIRRPVADARFQEGQQQLERVAALHLGDELIHRNHVLDRHDKLLDKLGFGIEIQQRSNHDRAAEGVDALHVSFDELLLAVLQHVLDELVHKPKAVAHIDQRPGILRFLLHEVVFDGLRVVEIALASDTLELGPLLQLARRLDVLEVDLGILGRVHDGAKIQVESLPDLDLAEDLHQVGGTHLLGVLGANPDAHVQVSLGVGPKNLLEHLHAVIRAERPEVIQQHVRIDHVRVGNHALHVRQIGVVLQRVLEQTRALAQHGDAGLVEVVPDILLQDRVRDLGRVHQVRLQAQRLQLPVVRDVLLEVVQAVARRLLQHAAAHEHVEHRLVLGRGLRGRHRDHLGVEGVGELERGLGGVAGGHLDEVHGVGGEVDSLRVRGDLVGLAGFDQRLDHLVVRLGLNVDREGERRVGLLDEVAELLAALDLVLLDPLLEELHAADLDDLVPELEPLRLVEDAALEQGLEVDE